MTAYYNEIEPKAAAWLRELIARGLIAPGEVDERDIRDIRPADLHGFAQCHFFAGIGVWSYALRQAGWPDDRPVWTGSCPCQPFSAAGKGAGLADERHLWPSWFWLIEQCRPGVLFGEQVASKDAEPWLDLVQADLEALGYAFGACAFPSAGIGAPHIRDRTYWLADIASERAIIRRTPEPSGNGQNIRIFGQDGRASALVISSHNGREQRELGDEASAQCSTLGNKQVEQPNQGCRRADTANASEFRTLANSSEPRHEQARQHERGQSQLPSRPAEHGGVVRSAGPTNGLWRDADWLLCRDGKWRPVEASPQQMVDGPAPSLGRVRDRSAAELQEEIDAWSVETQSERAASLRALRETLGAQARSVWAAGGLPGLHEAPFLLAFVRQLETQGWAVAEGIALSCQEASVGRLRVLRDDLSAPGASRERGLEGQPPGEPPDALHLLSSLLARHAHSAWGDAYAAHAEIGFPIGHGSPARVSRLRGYGNAINAEAARVFIEAVVG